MTYHNAIKYIKTSPNITPKDSSAASRVAKLFAALGNPQKNKKYIRLAGSNGKTVCARMLVSILNKSNICNGCLSMPIHSEIRENIRINGKPISMEKTVKYVEQIVEAVSRINQDDEATQVIFRPTEHEVMLCMAFLAFADHKCTLAIIENDQSANDPSRFLHSPFAAVICGRVPGGDQKEIAKIRAYITRGIKEIISCPSTPEAHKDIGEICVLANCRRTLAARNRCKIDSLNLRGASFTYKEKPYSIHLCGKFQITNALIAIETAEMLARNGYPITEESIQKGLSSVEAPCKFELISYSPTIIADSTHSGVAIATICTSLADFKDVMGTKIHLCLPDGDLVAKYIDTLRARGYTIEKVSLLCENAETTFDYSQFEADGITFISSKTAKKVASTALKGLQKDCTLFISGDSNFTINIRHELLAILGFGF